MPDITNVDIPKEPKAQADSGEESLQQSTITIDTGVSEQDFKLSPEQQAQRERLDKRSALALPIIDKVIPIRTLDQHLHSVIRFPYIWDKLEDDQRAEAARRLQKEPQDRKSLAYSIAQTDIPEADLEEYISTIYETAKDISPNNSGVEIGDINTLVFAIETIDQSHVFREYATKWKEKFLTGVDDETVDKRMQDIIGIFRQFSGAGISPKPEPRTQKDMDDLFRVFTETYEIGYSLPDNEQDQKIFRGLTGGIQRLGLEQRNIAQAQRALAIINNVISNPDRALVDRFIDIVSRYGQKHGITEEAVQGFGKLFSAMEKQDPQLGILLRGGNIWGMRTGDFGAADFLVHCYANKITPQNISEALLIARDVPTTTLARMEQNRQDGLSLAAPFGNLRDFIHDQRPYVHNVLAAMVHFYDTGDRSQLDAIIPKADYFNSKERVEMFYDRSLYDRIIPEVTKAERLNSGLRSIDILRRLKENTEPIPDAPPETSDSKLNEEMLLLTEIGTKGPIPKEKLGQTLDYVNSRLQEMMARGEIGIDPNDIHALSWLERQAFKTLQNLTYEDQSGAYKQDWFISVLRFQELTCSPHDFNEQEFEAFVSKLKSTTSDRQAYQLIGTRALESIYQLAKIQSGRGRADTGGLWSGNLPHELIGLVDPRPAVTEVGRRARNDDIKKITEPGYHPGD